MDQIYEFNDWTSAAKMRNIVDPCLRVDVGVLRNEERSDILGYQLTIYREDFDTIVYRLYVDVGILDTWSLTTEEAIVFLNQIGFPCRFREYEYTLNEETRKVLNAALDLGYTQIYRTIRPAGIMLISPKGEIPLEALTTHYNYHDYWFLSQVPVPIEGILEG